MKTLFRVKETLVTIICDEEYLRPAKNSVFEVREIIESKISEDPFFGITYDPYPVSNKDDPIIRRMCEASELAGVGPMAGVAGTVAVYAVEKMIEAGAGEAIVENGGDIAFYSPRHVPVGLYADHSILKDLAFDVFSDRILGICSSSRKIGPSVSLGNSNVSTVFSDNVILADCCATRLGNLVTDEKSVSSATETVGNIEGVRGCFACCGDRVAVFGDVPELVKADCGKLV